MAKNVVIVALLGIVLMLGNSLVRVENQRYGLLWALCRKEPLPTLDDFDCLERVQSRTSWVAHLYYAVLDR